MSYPPYDGRIPEPNDPSKQYQWPDRYPGYPQQAMTAGYNPYAWPMANLYSQYQAAAMMPLGYMMPTVGQVPLPHTTTSGPRNQSTPAIQKTTESIQSSATESSAARVPNVAKPSRMANVPMERTFKKTACQSCRTKKVACTGALLFVDEASVGVPVEEGYVPKTGEWIGCQRCRDKDLINCAIEKARKRRRLAHEVSPMLEPLEPRVAKVSQKQYLDGEEEGLDSEVAPLELEKQIYCPDGHLPATWMINKSVAFPDADFLDEHNIPYLPQLYRDAPVLPDVPVEWRLSARWAPFPSSHLLQHLLDTYFQDVAPRLPIIHKETFFGGDWTQDKLLLNSMCAIASLVSSHPAIAPFKEWWSLGFLNRSLANLNQLGKKEKQRRTMGEAVVGATELLDPNSLYSWNTARSYLVLLQSIIAHGEWSLLKRTGHFVLHLFAWLRDMDPTSWVRQSPFKSKFPRLGETYRAIQEYRKSLKWRDPEILSSQFWVHVEVKRRIMYFGYEFASLVDRLSSVEPFVHVTDLDLVLMPSSELVWDSPLEKNGTAPISKVDYFGDDYAISHTLVWLELFEIDTYLEATVGNLKEWGPCNFKQFCLVLLNRCRTQVANVFDLVEKVWEFLPEDVKTADGKDLGTIGEYYWGMYGGNLILGVNMLHHCLIFSKHRYEHAWRELNGRELESEEIQVIKNRLEKMARNLVEFGRLDVYDHFAMVQAMVLNALSKSCLEDDLFEEISQVTEKLAESGVAPKGVLQSTVDTFTASLKM